MISVGGVGERDSSDSGEHDLLEGARLLRGDERPESLDELAMVCDRVEGEVGRAEQKVRAETRVIYQFSDQLDRQ